MRAHRPNQKASTLVVAAGAVYVDFITKENWPATSAYHTEFTPARLDDAAARHAPRWSDTRLVGGAALKFAAHWAELRPGDAVRFTCRLPEHEGFTAAWREHAFVDDAAWLNNELRELEAPRRARPVDDPAAGFRVVRRGGGDTDGQAYGVSYTFHVPHPRRELGPIFTVQNGVAHELDWFDVLHTLKAEGFERYARTVIFLGGVQRTRLLETLAKASDGLETRRVLSDPRVELVIDFGRTDLRPTSGGQETDDLKETIRRCCRQAHLVFADTVTADLCGLREPANMPRRYLIERLRSPLPGLWELYERHLADGTAVRVRHRRFVPPLTRRPGLEEVEERPSTVRWAVTRQHGGDRPARVAELVGLLGRPRNGDPELTWKSKWSFHLDHDRPARPADITADARLRAELEKLQLLTEWLPTFKTLLVYGETGTGKDVVSRWLHRAHPTRAGGPFVAVECGRQDTQLTESELFGHVKGAYTGAAEDRAGAFECANNGVLLLDDLDALPLATQAKILRLLEDGRVRPVGASAEKLVDVFVIATTNVEPGELVRRGALRQDLYFRLIAQGGYLHLPPLRERPADALAVARREWEKQRTALTASPASPGGVPAELPATLEQTLMRSPLQGNFRVVRAAVFATFVETVYRLHERRGASAPGPPAAELPAHVVQWLEAGAAAPPVPAGSELLAWLHSSGRSASGATVAGALRELAALWREALAAPGGFRVETCLTKRQIAACLGFDETDARRYETLQAELRRKEGFDPVSAGRKAAWRLKEM